MSLLERIHSSADLKGLAPEQLDVLAREMREFLVETVSATGGHLAPSLGVVELLGGEPLEVGRGMDALEQAHRSLPFDC